MAHICSNLDDLFEGMKLLSKLNYIYHFFLYFLIELEPLETGTLECHRCYLIIFGKIFILLSRLKIFFSCSYAIIIYTIIISKKSRKKGFKLSTHVRR